MKLAIDNGLLRVSNCANWFNDIKALGFKYDKKTRELVGECTLDRLNGLAAIGRLPDAIEGERRRQAAVYAEIEAEKQEQDPHPFVKYPISVPLYKHQIKAANCAMRLFFANIAPQHRGFAYLMEMGTGKSLTAIAVAGALYKYHQVKRMMLACDNEVAQLKRIRFGPLMLDEALAPGQWRFCSEAEIRALKQGRSQEERQKRIA